MADVNEMVERVAKALSIADGMHPDACSNDEDETPAWKLYVDDARAAIAAMREPTRDMSAAGCPLPDDGGAPYSYDRHVTDEAWRMMIDAALK